MGDSLALLLRVPERGHESSNLERRGDDPEAGVAPIRSVDCIAIEPRFPATLADKEDEAMRRDKLRRLGQTARRRFRARRQRLTELGERAEARVSGAPPATAPAPSDRDIEALIRSLS